MWSVSDATQSVEYPFVSTSHLSADMGWAPLWHFIVHSAGQYEQSAHELPKQETLFQPRYSAEQSQYSLGLCQSRTKAPYYWCRNSYHASTHCVWGNHAVFFLFLTLISADKVSIAARNKLAWAALFACAFFLIRRNRMFWELEISQCYKELKMWFRGFTKWTSVLSHLSLFFRNQLRDLPRRLVLGSGE